MQPSSNDPARLPFRALLTPHRSLRPRAFLILMGFISLVSFAAGLMFWWMGAWPVTAFFGLDVALIYVAFKLNYRAARAYETIDVGRELLILTHVDAQGGREVLEFNPYWVRVHLAEDPDGHSRLCLVSHGQSHPVARFLSNEERLDFSRVLARALYLTRTTPDQA